MRKYGSMSVRVLNGVTEDVTQEWSEHVGYDVPILASGPWINATLNRLTSGRLTFLATEDGRGGGLQATVIDNPATGEMINLYRMLLADPKVWKFPAASVAARGGLRAQVPPVQDWLPHLAVLYPGFDSFVAASGGPTPALAAALVDAVLDWAREHGMKAVSFPYVRSDTLLPGVLAERGFLAVPLTFRSRLTLKSSFDEYLASLRSKRRSEVIKDRRRVAEAGISTKRCAFEDVRADLLALRCDLVERYGQKADRDAETANVQKLVSCFGADRIRVYCSFLDGVVIGFSLFAVWRDSWYAGYTGTYATPQTRGAYFDHLIYTPIADAIDDGARTIDLGIGAWQGKSLRGFDLTAVDLWVRALDPVTESAVEVAAPAMGREVGW